MKTRLEDYISMISKELTRPQFKLKADAETALAFLENTYRMFVEQRGRYYLTDSSQLHSAARWIVSGKNSLLLSGRTGSGKTTLGRAICYLMTKMNVYHGCRIISASDIIRKCSGDEFFNLRCVQLLMIDDLGIEGLSANSYGTVLMPVLDMLYFRYDKQLPTIITSNMTLANIGKTYGERIEDRMRELYDVITFGNDSYRI